jgi:hypothetical protein
MEDLLKNNPKIEEILDEENILVDVRNGPSKFA